MEVTAISLKTEGFGPLWHRTKDGDMHFYQYYSGMPSMGDERHHLYFVDKSQKVNKGDVCIKFVDFGIKPDKVFIWDDVFSPVSLDFVYKVVASSDRELLKENNIPLISDIETKLFAYNICHMKENEFVLKTDKDGLVLNKDNEVTIDLPETKMIDWNKLSMDDYINHLENEFMISSSGTAKSVFELIRNYRETQEGLRWLLKEYVENVNDEDAITNKLKELIGDK